MEIYNKINTAIDIIKNSDLKKIGYNDYSNYSYYTPEQVDKLVYDACNGLKLFIKFDLPRDQYGIYGTLLITNIENPDETVLYTMASDIPQITATNISQQLGGAATFAKRYLLQNAFDIVNNDLDFDTTQNTKKQDKPKQYKKEIKYWLTEQQFKKTLDADLKGIQAVLKSYDGKGEKNMKTTYRKELEKIVNDAKVEQKINQS